MPRAFALCLTPHTPWRTAPLAAPAANFRLHTDPLCDKMAAPRTVHTSLFCSLSGFLEQPSGRAADFIKIERNVLFLSSHNLFLTLPPAEGRRKQDRQGRERRQGRVLGRLLWQLFGEGMEERRGRRSWYGGAPRANDAAATVAASLTV